MCDICIMNRIKKEMISRRSFFKASAITGAIVTMGSIGLRPMLWRKVILVLWT